MSGPSPHPPLRVLRLLLRIAVLGLFAFAAVKLSGWAMMQTASPDGLSMAGLGVIALLLLAYALLIATPFVPAVEIGIALMLVQGKSVAPFVYLATVAGLLLAYGIGAFIPYARLRRACADLRLTALCRLLDRIEPLSPQDRLHQMSQNLPGWLAPVTTRYRYVTLGLLINLPGNSLLGGGGGLALVAGLSRLFARRATLLTFSLAVLPVPLFVWLAGAPQTWFSG